MSPSSQASHVLDRILQRKQQQQATPPQLTGVNLRNMLPRVARNSRRSKAASFSTGMVPATKPSCTALGSYACAASSSGAPIPEAAPAPVGQTGRRRRRPGGGGSGRRGGAERAGRRPAGQRHRHARQHTFSLPHRIMWAQT